MNLSVISFSPPAARTAALALLVALAASASGCLFPPQVTTIDADPPVDAQAAEDTGAVETDAGNGEDAAAASEDAQTGT